MNDVLHTKSWWIVCRRAEVLFLNYSDSEIGVMIIFIKYKAIEDVHARPLDRHCDFG